MILKGTVRYFFSNNLFGELLCFLCVSTAFFTLSFQWTIKKFEKINTGPDFSGKQENNIKKMAI